MPKDLTDVSQWETVAVPVGTDPATASSVETPFQTLTDRTKHLLDELSDTRLANWLNDADVSSVTGTDVPFAFCYDGSTGLYTIATANGYCVLSTGGLVWDDEGGGTPTGPNPGAGNDVTDIDSDDHGRRLACADSGAGDEVFYSDTPGTWSSCIIGGTPGLTFETVASNKSASTPVWVIADSATPSAIYRSPAGVTFAAVTVTGLTTQVNTVLHTGDDDNDCWILMTNTQCARSTDGGLTWTTAAHGLSSTNQRRAVAYDRVRGRFVVLIDGGRNVGYSDDNGTTWTEVANALPEAITGPQRRLVANSEGELMAWCGSASQIFTSRDGGETWTRRYTPSQQSVIYCVAGAGERGFVWAQYSGGWVIQRSLR